MVCCKVAEFFCGFDELFSRNAFGEIKWRHLNQDGLKQSVRHLTCESVAFSLRMLINVFCRFIICCYF